MKPIYENEKLTFIRKLEYLLAHHELLKTIINKPKNNRAINISIDDIITIMSSFPRDKWYDIIKPLIYDEDTKNEHICIINNDKVDNYPISIYNDVLHFNLDDLKKSFFIIEPSVPYYDKLNDGIVFCYDYLPLDIRYNKSKNNYSSKDYIKDIIYRGNIPSVLGIASDGKLITDYYIDGIDKNLYHYNYNISYHNYELSDYVVKRGEPLYLIKDICTGKANKELADTIISSYILQSTAK